MKNTIPLAVPVIRGNEWRYVKECLDDGFVAAAGRHIGRFEEMIAQKTGARHAVAVASGTAALHLSLVACGVRPGDAVIVPALTFIAPVNAVRYCGAEPIFMDCDPDTLCMDTDKLKEYLDRETEKGKPVRRIAAIIAVHIFGHPVDMKPLLKICRRLSITVIEDAAESIGSLYRGKPAGSMGRAGCLSFNGNKIVTTGGGGAIVTNDKNLAKRIRHLATQAKKSDVEYEHDEVGYNYRLSNIQAAIGVAQMEKLDEYIAIKKRNAQKYREMLAGIKGIEFLGDKPWAASNNWFYTLRVPKKDKKPLMKFLMDNGIQARPIWKLINSSVMYKNCLSYDIVNAVKAYDTCVNLPCSVNLLHSDIRRITGLIKNYFAKVGVCQKKTS